MKSKHYDPLTAKRTRRAYRLTIDAIRDAALGCGYAIGVHGSLARDIDLIACPWTNEATSAEELVEAVAVAADEAHPLGLIRREDGREGPRDKPHGRRAWSLMIAGGGYYDLSVMPRSGGEG